MNDPIARRAASPGRVRLALGPWLALGLAALPPPGSAPGAPPAVAEAIDTAAPASAVLHLANGGFVAGDLLDSADPDVVRWQGKGFANPFAFSAAALSAVRSPEPAAAIPPQGEFAFELDGGNVLHGALLGLDAEAVRVDSPRFGALRIRRSAVRRLVPRRDDNALIFAGLSGFNGWAPPRPLDGWRDELGVLVSDRAGAVLAGDFKLPPRALIEFLITWEQKPDFILSLGTDGTRAGDRRAFGFEIWGGDLVARRETTRRADVLSVQALEPGPGRAHLLAFLDQEKERMIVVSAGGKVLADLAVSDRQKGAIRGGISLVNLHGGLGLRRLRISRWNGEPPREIDAKRARLQHPDGTSTYGEVISYDRTARSFRVRKDQGTTDVPERLISEAILSPGRDTPLGAFRAIARDGSQLSGTLVGIAAGTLRLQSPEIEGEVRIPIDRLQALVALRLSETPPAAGKQVGFLELPGVLLRGQLVPGATPAPPGGSVLAWLPAGAVEAATLEATASGRVVFKETPAASPVVTNPALRMNPDFNGAADRARTRFLREPVGGPPRPRPEESTLILQTGDSLSVKVLGIDEDGLSYRSSTTGAGTIRHDQIKALDLEPDRPNSIGISTSKRERLLTLPRMQKENPPTHLVRSRGGDYLRGRLVAMDDKSLRIEVRLETREIPLDRVVRIIWLHPESLNPAKAAPPPKPEEGTIRVQAVRGDGSRLTFRASRFDGDAVTGQSAVIGACGVDLKAVDQLLLGEGIEEGVANFAYQRWKLHPAEEPKFAREDPDGSGPPDARAGTESGLVGKHAPPLALPLLEGGLFDLSKERGKVVVLDFWATWCGPCLQAMPQVEGVAREFADRGVRLVAVNLQESPRAIRAMLERHKLGLQVVLDGDGAVAARYEARAIPQTVVIDRDGKVLRVFVGSSPHLGDQLRDALNAALKVPPPAEAPKS